MAAPYVQALQQHLAEASESAQARVSELVLAARTFDPNSVDTPAVREWFASLATPGALAVPVVAGYLAYQAYSCRARRVVQEGAHWAHSLALTAVAALGGGVACALLMGAKPKALSHDTYVPLCALMWYLMSFRALFFLFPIAKPFALFAYEMYRTVTLLTTFWAAVKIVPHSVFGQLLLPIISVCGGMWIAHLLRRVSGDSEAVASDFSRPSSKLRNVFWAVVAYYVAVDPAGLIFAPQNTPVPADERWAANAAVFAFFQLEGLFLLFNAEVPLLYPLEWTLSLVLGLGAPAEPRKAQPKTEEQRKKKNQ
eukprot:m51a1_g9592 hypothetical protein (311) ;mRNA; f:1026878-1028120